ncbi:MAG TPA: hypothetical protein VL325_12015 [Pyrinomonadaceae bacterium]|nr:hypothetical protein [Pyrinomonadaceae bacterium]
MTIAIMNEPGKKYWFPAKRYGWGWGVPHTWQGWCALLLYVLAVCFAIFILDPAEHPFRFFASLFASTSLFIAICWIKGEPPRWRWGGTDRE